VSLASLSLPCLFTLRVPLSIATLRRRATRALSCPFFFPFFPRPLAFSLLHAGRLEDQSPVDFLPPFPVSAYANCHCLPKCFPPLLPSSTSGGTLSHSHPRCSSSFFGPSFRTELKNAFVEVSTIFSFPPPFVFFLDAASRGFFRTPPVPRLSRPVERKDSDSVPSSPIGSFVLLGVLYFLQDRWFLLGRSFFAMPTCPLQTKTRLFHVSLCGPSGVSFSFPSPDG